MEYCKEKHSVSFNSFYYLLMMLPMTFANSDLTFPDLVSNFYKSNGHYPYWYCEFTNAWLNTTAGTFFYRSDTNFDGGDCTDVWDIQNSEYRIKEPPKRCDKTYPHGYSFVIFYIWGYSNYYHMHYDVLIPMYQDLYYRHQPKNALLMPAVESQRLERIAWNTSAFLDQNKWWMEILHVLAGDHKILALDERAQNKEQIICFERLHISSPSYKPSDRGLIKNMIRYVKESFGITETINRNNRLAIISRKGRRKLLNEQEMVKAVEDLVPTDLVDFQGMTFKQQVEQMQYYTILVGVNGAGFMNALYLPPNGVAIQLAPYNTTLNINMFAELMRARGPYLEWHNTHEENHFVNKRHPTPHGVDTIVDTKEFRELIQKALARLAKDEL